MLFVAILRINTKNTYFKEIVLHGQIMITILGSTVNLIGSGCRRPVNERESFTSIMNKLFTRAPTFVRKVAMSLVQYHLVLIMCLISSDK